MQASLKVMTGSHPFGKPAPTVGVMAFGFNFKENEMNVYAFNCTVWVRGETKEDALKELHDEVDYHFGLDNNLVALESDEGKIVEGETA